jgi:glycerol kinase
VEHDPTEILQNTDAVIAEALNSADLKARDLAAVGITNQRETICGTGPLLARCLAVC